MSRPFLPPTGITKCHLAPWIMWEIWTARNKFLFSNLMVKTEDSLSRSIVMAREWQNRQVATIAKQRTCRPQPYATSEITLKTDTAWNAASRWAWINGLDANPKQSYLILLCDRDQCDLTTAGWRTCSTSSTPQNQQPWNRELERSSRLENSHRQYSQQESGVGALWRSVWYLMYWLYFWNYLF